MKLEEQIELESTQIYDLVNKDNPDIIDLVRLLVCVPLGWALRDPDGQTLIEAIEEVFNDSCINDVLVVDILRGK